MGNGSPRTHTGTRVHWTRCPVNVQPVSTIGASGKRSLVYITSAAERGRALFLSTTTSELAGRLATAPALPDKPDEVARASEHNSHYKPMSCR